MKYAIKTIKDHPAYSDAVRRSDGKYERYYGPVGSPDTWDINGAHYRFNVLSQTWPYSEFRIEEYLVSESRLK